MCTTCGKLGNIDYLQLKTMECWSSAWTEQFFQQHYYTVVQTSSNINYNINIINLIVLQYDIYKHVHTSNKP